MSGECALPRNILLKNGNHVLCHMHTHVRTPYVVHHIIANFNKRKTNTYAQTTIIKYNFTQNPYRPASHSVRDTVNNNALGGVCCYMIFALLSSVILVGRCRTTDCNFRFSIVPSVKWHFSMQCFTRRYKQFYFTLFKSFVELCTVWVFQFIWWAKQRIGGIVAIYENLHVKVQMWIWKNNAGTQRSVALQRWYGSQIAVS